MTTIAALEGIDYAVLVADSQITEDNLVTLATSTPKIVEVGKFLVGISGDTRPGDILAYNWKPPLYRGEDPAQFMGKKVIPSINTAFNDNNYDYNKVDKDGGLIISLLLTVTSFALLAISLFSKQMSERTALVVEVSLLLAISLQLSSLIWS
jgi:hypothetical protein